MNRFPAAGGSPAAGSPAGGSPAAGSPAGGSPAAGSPAAGALDSGALDSGALDSGAPDGGSPAAGRSPARMTARGAMLAMFAMFFPGVLLADWLAVGPLTGLSFVAGCVVAARYAKRDALLAVVVTPPVIFLTAVICDQAITAPGASGHAQVMAVAEGTFLVLATVAPWLFAGVGLTVLIALLRGLPQSMRELRQGLRGDTDPRTGSAASARPGSRLPSLSVPFPWPSLVRIIPLAAPPPDHSPRRRRVLRQALACPAQRRT